MAKVIAVMQLKGGAGRSTVSTNLAGELSKKGRVVLIDSDLPQGTSTSWRLLRGEAGRGGDELILAPAESSDQLHQAVKGLRKKADYIVIDGPPRIADLTREAMTLSDICLIPLGASISETWATDELERTLNEARKKTPVDARILWTRFRGWTRSAQDLSDAVAHDFDLPQLETRIGFRVAYADAMARGLTVCEWRDQHAREEFQQVVNEVLKILG